MLIRLSSRWQHNAELLCNVQHVGLWEGLHMKSSAHHTFYNLMELIGVFHSVFFVSTITSIKSDWYLIKKKQNLSFHLPFPSVPLLQLHLLECFPFVTQIAVLMILLHLCCSLPSSIAAIDRSQSPSKGFFVLSDYLTCWNKESWL